MKLNFFAPAYKKIVDAVEDRHYDGNPYVGNDDEAYEMAEELSFLRACAEGEVEGAVRYDQAEALRVIKHFFKGAKLAEWELPWKDAMSVIEDVQDDIIKQIASAFTTALMKYAHLVTSLEDPIVIIGEKTYDMTEYLDIIRKNEKVLQKRNQQIKAQEIPLFINDLLSFLTLCEEAGLKPSL